MVTIRISAQPAIRETTVDPPCGESAYEVGWLKGLDADKKALARHVIDLNFHP